MVAKVGGGGRVVIPKQVDVDTPAGKPATNEHHAWVPGSGRPRPAAEGVEGPAKVGDGESFSQQGLSSAQLRRVMPHLSAEKADAMLPHLNRAMKEFHIDTPQRASAFLAQLAHESGELKYFEELASGSAYEGRRDLGNTHSGDGVRFKGRGPIQLTGRANYEAAGKALGLDLVNNPELASRPDIGFRVAGWFWSSRHLNSLADKGEFDQITRRVNGGFNGKASRDSYYASARAALGGGLGGGPLSTGETPLPNVDRPRRYELAHGSTYQTADPESARMVRSYSQRHASGSRPVDPNELYLALLLAMSRGWGGESLMMNPAFIEFARSAGWQEGQPMPEALMTEFLAQELSARAETNPRGVMGALDELAPAHP